MVRTPSSKTTMASAANDLATAVGQLLRRLRSETATDELNLSQVGVLGWLDQHGPSSATFEGNMATL